MAHDTPHPIDSDVKARRREDRKVWRNALLASFLLHALAFLLWSGRAVPLDPRAAAGPASGDDQAAAGSMQSMNIRTPAPRPVVPPPVPVPTLEPMEPLEFDEEPQLEAPAVDGSGLQGLEGPGIEDGSGLGDGGTSDSGLFRATQPVPRNTVLPPMDLDTDVEIWVFVDERGRVVPDSTRIRPRVSDRNLREGIMERAAEWIFEPAQQGGEAVASWFPYRVGGGS